MKSGNITLPGRMLFLLVLFILSPGITGAGTSQKQAIQTGNIEIESLREFILNGMGEWGIPGLAIAVVQHDNVIFAEGFGFLKTGEDTKVDEHTLFGIASTTKAMTATVLGILVDEGLVDWDDPVIKHLPGFQLHDPWVTRNATIRDLLTHQVGIGRVTGNRIEFMPNHTRAEVMYQMRYLENEAPFRSRYVYSNVMYMVAGEIVEAVTGTTWDDFITDRLFRTLGMNRSNTSITQFNQNDSNIAWPHQEINGEVVPIMRRNFDNVGPSASVNSSALELTRWMRLNLGEPGVLDGVRYISEQTMHEIHRPQVATRISDPYGPQAAYALGWSVSDYRGHRQLQHGGATDGMNTSLLLLPNEEVGIVILTNTFNQFTAVLGNHVKDILLGLEPRNWADEIRQSYLRSYERALQLKTHVDDNRIADTSPSLPLKSYTGIYIDEFYGKAEVFSQNGSLRIRFWDDPTQELVLEHWHFDTFKASWINPAKREKFVYFTLDESGYVELLNVTWTLRPILLQVGIYPSNYNRLTRFQKQ